MYSVAHKTNFRSINTKDMLPIRKNDIVSFVQSGRGKVLDIIATNLVNVYKVQKLDDRQVMYVEDKVIQLEKQCLRSWLKTYAKEVLNFLSYTLKIRVGNR